MALVKRVQDFRLERYFAKYEFKVRLIMCCSDCEPWKMADLLQLADDDARSRWDNLSLAYTESQGLPALRQEAAKLYEKLTADDIAVCTPEEGIYNSMAVLLSPGDHVVAVGCAYQSLHEVAKGFGAQVTIWEPKFEVDGRVRFDFDELEALVTPTTKLVVVNFPHNPTGILPSHNEFNRIVDICRRAGAWLFSDEMYRYLEYDPAQRLPNGADVYPKAISLHGMSKTYALPGIRLGWVASQDKEFIANFLSYKDYTTICHSAPSEVLALIALRNQEKIARMNVDLIQSNIAAMREFFSKHQDTFSWQEPSAGSICFARLRTGESIDEFCHRLVEESGVLLLPSTHFLCDAASSKGFFRLGLGRKNFKEGLIALDEWLQSKT